MQAEAETRAKNLRVKMAELATRFPSKTTPGVMKYDAVTFFPSHPFRSESQKNEFETDRYCLNLNGALGLHLKKEYLDNLLGSTPAELRMIRKWYLYCAHLNSLYLLLDSFVLQDSGIAYFYLEDISTQNTNVVSQAGISVGPTSHHKLVTSVNDQPFRIPDDLLKMVGHAFERATADFQGVHVFSELAKSLAAHKSGDFSTSLVLSWFVIERFLESCWEQFLEDAGKRISTKRREILDDSRSYTASVKSQILELGGAITLDQLTALDVLRNKRNRMAHPPKPNKGKVSFQADAETCQSAFALLEDFTLKYFGIPLFFNSSYSEMGVYDRQ